MTAPPTDDKRPGSFAVLLGVNGVAGPRSGIGRQMVEVARVLTAAPEIADLALLLDGRVEPAAFLDALATAPPIVPARTGSRLRAALGRIPGVLALRDRLERRRLDRFAAELARRTARPVIYHEFNTIARAFSGPTVVTIHDLSWLAVPEAHPAERVAWLNRRLPRTLRQASRFIAVSDFTAQEMVQRLGINRDRIDIVPPGVSRQFQPRDADAAAPTVARYGLRDRGYVLAVSTLEPRKNFDRLLAAHGLLPSALRQTVPLVIVGGRGWGTTLTDAAAERALREGRLRLLGHISDDDLVALYASCAVAAYPSLYEGFGLPVLEAMACGAPVVTSRTTALPDTAGGAAILVDPLDVDAISGALRTVLEDGAFADRLRAGGPARAAPFTWGRMAAGMIACWQTVLTASLSDPAGSPRSGRGRR